MGAIVWLASYPKSGNTWVRALLTNYLHDRVEPADIDALDGALLATDRHTFDEFVGVEASDLSAEEILRCRPEVYRRLASEATGRIYIKVHDAYRQGNTPLFPLDVTALAVYIVRNPLDVAVSLAHHLSEPMSSAVERVCSGFAQSPEHDHPLRLEEPLLCWSAHVESWIDESGLPLHIVRYEDLATHPHATLATLVEAIGLVADRARLSQSVMFSSFDRLRALEEAGGFKERPPRMPVFFRKGQPGDWRGTLTTAQVARIIDVHGGTMRRFRYLADDGTAC